MPSSYESQAIGLQVLQCVCVMQEGVNTQQDKG